MVISGLLQAGPHRTAIGASNGGSDQPGSSPRCCPTASQSAASRRVCFRFESASSLAVCLSDMQHLGFRSGYTVSCSVFVDWHPVLLLLALTVC